jgi:hypothetical protein
MLVAKVDGTTMLAKELVDGTLFDVLIINDKFLVQTLSREVVNTFITRENEGDLLGEMTIGTQSAVVSRELKQEEQILIDMAYGYMEIAKTKAVKGLENEYFTKNF